MGLSSYSTTPASNTTISGISIAEGCAPSGINDAIRQMMADIASGVTVQQLPTATGTANAIVVALSPAKGAYAGGDRFQFVAAGTVTGAATINYGTGGVKNFMKRNAAGSVVNLAINDVTSGDTVDVEYDGTQVLLLAAKPYIHGADIASAATVVLNNATGDYVFITGTTGITAITLAEGAQVLTKFGGALTLTNSGTLICPGAANFTTATDDVLLWRGEAGGVVRCVGGIRATGQALVASNPFTGSPATGNLTKFASATTVTNGDLSGDVTTSGTLATTLATVNGNVGSFTNASVTVNAKGLVTAVSTGTTPVIPSALAIGQQIWALHTSSTVTADTGYSAASLTPVVGAWNGASGGIINTGDTISGTWKALLSQPVAGSITVAAIPFVRTA